MIIKNQIQRQIIHELQENISTKTDLAKIFDVSITAITSHINELKTKGLVLESDTGFSTGGRIPKVLTINNKRKFIFGISISKNLVRIILMNLGKEILKNIKIEKNFNTLDDYMIEAQNSINSILSEFNIDITDVLVGGLSLPGPINSKTRIVEYLNIGFHNISFDYFQNFFDFKIYVENEANLSLFYEKHERNIDDNNLIVQVSVNEGIGAGIFLNNSFLKSNIGYAGEVGNIIVDYKNNITSEDITSYEHIIKKFNTLNNSTITDINEFFTKENRTNEHFKVIVDELVLVLKTTIHNINMVLDPAMIIMGGKLVRELLIVEDISNIKDMTSVSKNFSNKTQLIFSENKNSTTQGAALYSLNVILGQHDL